MTRSGLAAQAAAIIEQLSPGGRLVRTRRLPGGLTCRMDVLDIERADGSRWEVSLRRFVERHYATYQTEVTREFETLRALESAGVPAPRPLLLDESGNHFGVPAMVLSYLPGRPILAPANSARWTEGLAAALLQAHSVTAERFDLSGMRVFGRDEMRARLNRWRRELKPNGLTAQIVTVLEEHLPHIALLPPTLVHNDFWSGNVVWQRGRVAGIVDWSDAVVGDPRADVSEARIDFVLAHNLGVADAFRHDYERLSGEHLRDLWYFDLFRGLRALEEYRNWLSGYRDLQRSERTRVVHVQQQRALGLPDLHESRVGARLRRFLRRALDEAIS